MASPTRPNILLIMTDQQRFDQLGFMSNGYFETPNLDRLARNGVVFDAAYANATICIPSRGSLLTGLAPHRYPKQGRGAALQEGFWTIGHALRQAGYQTAMIGKMHLHPIKARHGFSHTRMAEHLGLVYGPEEMDDYIHWLVSKGRGDSKGTHIFGPGQEAERAEFQKYHQAIPFAYEKEYHPTNWIARESVEFLKGRDPNRPYLMIASFPHPHSPFDPPAPYDTMYDLADAQLPGETLEFNAGLAPSARGLMMNRKGFGFCAVEDIGEEKQRRMATYIRALIRQIDDAVGEILAHVDLSNTVIFFTTDHGDYYGRRGVMLKTPGIPFDDIARTPFFCSGAGVPAGRRVGHVVQNTDFALTCLELAGVQAPGVRWDTRSLVPHFGSGAVADDRLAYCWSNYDWPMVRQGRYKFFRNQKNGEEMLFDMVDDPRETTNRVGDPALAGTAAALRRGLHEMLLQGIPDLPRFDAWQGEGR